MKLYRPPKCSGAHRFACLSLYRALLVQCPRVPLPDERQKALRRLIRKSFKQNKDVQSERWLIQGFKAGYEDQAVDVLRSAALGDVRSTDRILTLLDKASPTKETPSSHDASTEPAPIAPTVTPPPKKKKKEHVMPWPGATPVLSRPYLNISGRRRVPYLINANSFPMLRFKKPQSPFLSRVLSNKIKEKERRIRKLQELQSSLWELKMEDQWDAHVAQTVRKLKSTARSKLAMVDRTEPSWTHATSSAIQYYWEQQNLEFKKREDLARKMFDIVQKERALARQEKSERSRLRRASARSTEEI